MAYLRIPEAGNSLAGLGCGASCGCGPCRKQYSGLGEIYIRDDDEEEEPERVPPPPAGAAPAPAPAPPPPTPEPTPPKRGPRRGRRGRSAEPPPPNLSGWGPHGLGCGCTAQSSMNRRPPGSRLGEYGWAVKTPLSSEGHEVLTRSAIGASRTIPFSVAGKPLSRVLTAAEEAEIVAGNRSVDLGWAGTGVVFAFSQDEQKRHSLRRNFGQPLPAALADVIGSLRSQHAAILAEKDPKTRLRRIGQATHLIQDSFSPAHTDRRPGSGWCIYYIKNYGRGKTPAEHGVPSDDRDKIANPVSRPAALQAIAATREYLSIVFKAVHGRTAPDPVASSEAAAEFARFVGRRFHKC
jgi:hypothetical protein